MERPDMMKYIRQTPQSVRDCLAAGVTDNCAALADVLCDNKERTIIVTGCGTSYNLALYFERLLTNLCGLRAVALPSADLINYRRGMIKDSVVVALSHTGATKASVDAVKAAKEVGVPVVTMTSKDESPMAQLSDLHVKLAGGVEACMPKTLTYTCTAMQMLVVAAEVQHCLGIEENKINLPDPEWIFKAMTDAIEKNDAEIRRAAEELKDQNLFLAIGAGTEWILAIETALKIRENNYTAAMGFETEEYTHGNVPTLEPGRTAILITHEGPALQRTLDILQCAKHLGATSMVVGDATVAEFDGAQYTIEVESCGAEEIDGLIAALPLQMFSYYLSWAKGIDPNMLRQDTPQYKHAATTWVFPVGTH